MERFGLSEAQQERVWEVRERGVSLRVIGLEIGADQARVARYVRLHGGRPPAARQRAERALSVGEREEISRGLARRWSCREIAGRLGRSSSTISREVARNGGRKNYRAEHAEQQASARGRRPKIARLAANPRLRSVVEEKLGEQWSPQQISGWLRVAYADDAGMQISHETIYLSLFVQSRGALNKELTKELRTGRIVRLPRGHRRTGQGRGQINDQVNISERPPEVEDRAVPGHWEGDLLMGTRPSAIATLVERSTRYVQLLLLPDGFAAPAVRDALEGGVQRLPTHLRKSLTWDQGGEMAEHLKFTVATDVQVYFCDPRSPWQRGSNENTNGLLRQYFPKRRFDFKTVTQEDLDVIAAKLNGRPRQTLGFKTPAQMFAALLPPTGQNV